MKLNLLKRRLKEDRVHTDRSRYVSSIQRDVQKYAGWSEDNVNSDYRASKSVRTIVTLGYLEYESGVLVLTPKGRMLMQDLPIGPATLTK